MLSSLIAASLLISGNYSGKCKTLTDQVFNFPAEFSDKLTILPLTDSTLRVAHSVQLRNGSSPELAPLMDRILSIFIFGPSDLSTREAHFYNFEFQGLPTQPKIQGYTANKLIIGDTPTVRLENMAVVGEAAAEVFVTQAKLSPIEKSIRLTSTTELTQDFSDQPNSIVLDCNYALVP